MISTCVGPLLLFLLTCLLPSLAEAKQVALVVGIARYEHVESLKNPVRDAGAIADRLRDRGFDVIEAFDADAFAIERAKRRFLEAAKGADLALFYFAGHGIQLFDRNVLLVRDAAPQSASAIDALGLDLNAFMTEVRSQGPVRSAFLIDACRNNPLSFDDSVALLRRLEPAVVGGTGERGVTRAPTRGLSGIALPPRRLDGSETLAFFAAQPGAASFDGEGRNSYFVEGLLEGFARSGRSLSEILRGAGAFVRTVTNGQQVPQLVSDWTTDIVLGQADQIKVRYLNAYRAGADLEPMPDVEARIVGEAQRAYPALTGSFVVKESQSFTDNYIAASE
ncbi:MAG: caspase family protein, partial [Proteobacteria bacterium]|nr:caspase family protein [Pseudomonadota bacterium]